MSSVTPCAEEPTPSIAVKPKSARTFREVQPQVQPLPRRPQTSEGKPTAVMCCTILSQTPFGQAIFWQTNFMAVKIFGFLAAGRF